MPKAIVAKPGFVHDDMPSGAQPSAWCSAEEIMATPSVMDTALDAVTQPGASAGGGSTDPGLCTASAHVRREFRVGVALFAAPGCMLARFRHCRCCQSVVVLAVVVAVVSCRVVVVFVFSVIAEASTEDADVTASISVTEVAAAVAPLCLCSNFQLRLQLEMRLSS